MPPILRTVTPPPAAAPAPAPRPAAPVAQEKPKPPLLYAWDGDGRTVTHVRIDVDSQRARFYSGEEEIGWTVVATGVRKYPTPIGRFAVIEKLKKKRSNLYGKIYDRQGRVLISDAKQGRDRIPAGGRFVGASMPYFIRLTYDGLGMHAGPIPRPGHRASHGCIRVPKAVAPVVFAHVPLGTPVTITGEGPRRAAPRPAPHDVDDDDSYTAR